MRIRVYNIRATFSCHCRGTTKTSWANGLKKHLFVRIWEQNKQTNQLFLYVQKSTDNCYLIPVDNKHSIFIPEQRKNRLVPKKRICVLSMSYYWYSVLSLSFSFAQSFHSCSRYRRKTPVPIHVLSRLPAPGSPRMRSFGYHVTLSEFLKICQKLQYREKSSSKKFKNKLSALSLHPADAWLE